MALALKVNNYCLNHLQYNYDHFLLMNYYENDEKLPDQSYLLLREIQNEKKKNNKFQ